MVRSSDYFVGSGQHVRWNRQVDLLRRLEVDHQLKLRGLLHRQIGGGCARAQPADSRIFFAGRASAGRQSAKTIAQSVRRMTFLLTSFLPRSLSALCPLLSALCSLSLNHPIRTRQYVGGNCEADLPRRLEVDDQLEFCRLLDGKVRRLGSFEDLVYINGDSS